MKCTKPEPELHWTDELGICHWGCKNCREEIEVIWDCYWKHKQAENKLKNMTKENSWEKYIMEESNFPHRVDLIIYIRSRLSAQKKELIEEIREEIFCYSGLNDLQTKDLLKIIEEI